MAVALLIHETVAPTSSPVMLALALALAATVYVAVLVMLPGGRADVAGLMADLRRGLNARKGPAERPNAC
jgi:hypothetical protein